MHEYELDNETLQKAQLEQHKIFQNFPTSLSPAALTPPPLPLPAGTNPEVSPLLKLNDSDNGSPEAFLDTKTGNTLMDNYDKSLTQTHTYKKSALIRFPSQQRLSELLALQSQVSDANSFSVLPVLRNSDTQGHIIPQYDSINLFHMQQMKKAIAMYGPHSPFTRELLNVVTSSIGNFILYDWRTLIQALLKPGEYLQWTMWFHDIARDHANKNARAGTPQNQITYEMLTGSGQFDTIEAQIHALLCCMSN